MGRAGKTYRSICLIFNFVVPLTGFCYGCGRSNEEKKIWKLENTTNEWKTNNMKVIKTRLNGWQLESFEQSYTHKVENGISLFKKKLNNE